VWEIILIRNFVRRLGIGLGDLPTAVNQFQHLLYLLCRNLEFVPQNTPEFTRDLQSYNQFMILKYFTDDIRTQPSSGKAGGQDVGEYRLPSDSRLPMGSDSLRQSGNRISFCGFHRKAEGIRCLQRLSGQNSLRLLVLGGHKIFSPFQDQQLRLEELLESFFFGEEAISGFFQGYGLLEPHFPSGSSPHFSSNGASRFSLEIGELYNGVESRSDVTELIPATGWGSIHC
jgi:hypothetical protein